MFVLVKCSIMMKLENQDFDKKAFLRRLESIVYLMLTIPLVGFGWVFLEKEKAGGLRVTFFEDPDLMFHAVMFMGVAYVFMRTIGTWKRDVRKVVDGIEEIDRKLQVLQKPIIARNFLWAFGAAIGTYGLYEKGDMVYAIVFTAFLLLITTNRPSAQYFVKFLQLKGEEKNWMLKENPEGARGSKD